MVKQTSSASNLLKFRRASDRMSSSSSQLEESNQVSPQQRYVTTSTSLGHVLMMIILGFCRRITCGIELKRRLVFYFCVITFGGIVADFAPPIVHAFMPIKVTKYNPLNQWFVKIGWFWTLVLVTPFISMVSEVLSFGSPLDDDEEVKVRSKLVENSRNIPSVSKTIEDRMKSESFVNIIVSKIKNKDLVRVVVSTFVWWSCTSAFEWFDSYTASCSISGHKTKDACLRGLGRWSGFDISGHTFLLLFSNLIILEECIAMVGWEPLGNVLNAKQQHYKKLSKGDHSQHIVYSRYIVPIRVLFIHLTLLSLLWDFMLIQTALFYHTMVQKLVAFFIATFFWFLLYRVIYRVFNITVNQLASRH